MAKFQWVRVSKQSPCRVCEHPDWCSVSADGAVAKCMRVEEGSFRSKDDQNGGRYHLHRLADGLRPCPAVPPPGPEARRADADALHEVYSALLARLALSEAHREALRRRGLSDEAIARAGYRTLPGQGRPRIVRALRDYFGDQVLRVPGFVVKEGRSGRYLTLRGPAGLAVPCRDREGRVVALKVRRDEAGEGTPRYVYVSSAGHGGPGPGSPVHVPLGTPAAAESARLTEGELKADVAQALTGTPTLSVPGVTNWRTALAALEALGVKTVRLAFDADCWDKPAVAQALSACAEALAGAGLALELERWDAADGKGIDDLLAAGKAPELLQGDAAVQTVRDILAASAGEEPAPPDALARLQDVLDAGGAEAVFVDADLLSSLARLAVDDPAGFAAARAAVKGRLSVRDLDKALKPLVARLKAERKAAQPGGAGEMYLVEGGAICRRRQTEDGPVVDPLCNFSARIAEHVVRDDGAERLATLAVEGEQLGRGPLPRAEVDAAEFARMEWLLPAWGPRAVVYAGQGTRDHLRAALQLLSPDAPTRTVYAHTGWRQVGGDWAYLHGGGAVGEEGAADVPVSLPPALAGFLLPAPPDRSSPEAELAEAIRASLGLVRLGPGRLTFPLLAAAYRAALGGVDFGLHLAGPTGCFKSEAAALAQQHYGAGMDARHLPAGWSSTGNALEALAFAAKDALLVVDDFCPAGSAADVQRSHKDADRLFRGQGNHAGRQRMRADATLRPAKPPRGLVLSTGEDVPRGQSLRARLLVLEVSPGDFGPAPPEPNPVLTRCQADAAGGKYALAMSGFLRWLAPRYEEVRGRLRAEAAELREQARGDGQHARTPGIVADLALGLRHLLDFALSAGAISEAERAEYWRRGWAALGEAAAAQAAHVAAAEPAGMFLRLLSAAIAGGYAHVADPAGDAPPEPERWGWRAEEFYAREGTAVRHKAQGVRVGWLADGELYLEPEASFAAAQSFARDQGDCLPVAAATLRRRLRERGLLASTDEARGKLTVRRTLQGARRDVLHIARAGVAPAQRTGPTGPTGPGGGGSGPESWAGSWAENGLPRGEAAHGLAPQGTCRHLPAGSGPGLGRLGRSDTGEETTPCSSCDGSHGDGWGDWQ
jgi:hypothetical protein